MRACADVREPRAGNARPLRIHGALPRQAEDPLRLGLAQPSRVRGRQRTEGPLVGGIRPVNGNGADSDS